MNTNLNKNEKKYLEQISRVIFYDWEHSDHSTYSDYPSDSTPVDYETLFYNRNMQDVDLHDSKRISTMKSLINKGIIKFTSINESNDSIHIINNK
tara:strand:+ start:194 stop:478 length:285 start_codon:yes stop_codon:yes gene_type:complete